MKKIISNQKHGFTLIELLVVIAIIAILAAILFPVFAQAKAAAKGTTDLSNLKQLDLANLMYANDFDDAFSLGTICFAAPGNSCEWNTTWAGLVVPYVKNGNIQSSTFGGTSLGGASLFRSPLDGDTSLASWSDGTEGVAISYGANAIMIFDPASGHTKNIGVFSNLHADDGFGNSSSLSQTSVGQVSNTVLLADKFNKDARAYGSFGVSSAFPGDVFNNVDYGWNWIAPGMIPNGNPFGSGASWWWSYNNHADNKYPNGANGSVGVSGNGKTNFAFADGHTKSMTPTATNPDPVNLPAQNMWDATR